jgi:hypothetical protein
MRTEMKKILTILLTALFLGAGATVPERDLSEAGLKKRLPDPESVLFSVKPVLLSFSLMSGPFPMNRRYLSGRPEKTEGQGWELLNCDLQVRFRLGRDMTILFSYHSEILNKD